MTAIAIPAWLLRTFGSGPSVDALLGDLREEYQQGKSAAWFWGQAITGVAVTFIAEVRSHWLVTLRAVAFAWVMRVVFLAATITWLPWARFSFAALVFLSVFAPWATGWLVGRSHRRHRTSSVLAAALTFFAIDVLGLWMLWAQAYPAGATGMSAGWLAVSQAARTIVLLTLFLIGGLRGVSGERHSLA